MLKSYFKIVLRNIAKKKLFSLLNILCLAIGLSSFLLIINYVIYEYSHDRFHEDAEDIYRVYLTLYKGEEVVDRLVTVPFPFGSTLASGFSEISNFTRIRRPNRTTGNNYVEYKDKKFNERNVLYVDSTFFSVFSFAMKRGNPQTALRDPNTVVISQDAAKKYFGDEDPINKSLKFVNKHGAYYCKVTGVFEKPENTHYVRNDLLVSVKTFFPAYKQEYVETAWFRHGFHTYLKLADGTDPKAFEASFRPYIHERNTFDQAQPDVDFVFQLQPLKDVHLHSSHIKYNREFRTASPTIISFLIFISLIILVISWLNYVNLNSATVADRAKEVGLRKLMGGYRKQLMFQFFLESLIINATSIALAALIVNIGLPYYNQFVKMDISFYLLYNEYTMAGIGALFLAGVLISSIIPAYIFSSLQPTTALSGRGGFSHSKRGIVFRKTLGIIQLSIALVCLVGTFVVYSQIDFMANKDLGFDIENVLVIREPVSVRDSTFSSRIVGLKDEIKNFAGVQNASISSDVPGEYLSWLDLFEVKGQEDKITLYTTWIGYDFLSTYGIEILQGRNYAKDFVGTDRAGIILNESALKLFNIPLDEATNHELIMYQVPFKIVGIIKDYHTESMRKSVIPAGYFLNADIPEIWPGRYKFRPAYLSVRIHKSADKDAVVAEVERKWQASFPDAPIEYFYLDDYFDLQYASDRQFGKMFGIFSLVAIAIACIGIFSVSYSDILRRTKEIGVRKVVGASIDSILMVLFKDVVKIVVLANVICWPVAYFLLSNWLNDYANRIAMPWWMYLFSGVLILVIILLTISYHTVVAAMQNPVKTLRYE